MKCVLLIAVLLSYSCSENFGIIRKKRDDFLKSDWFTLTTEHPDTANQEIPNVSQRWLEVVLMKQVKDGQPVVQTLNFKMYTKKDDEPVQSRLILVNSSTQQELKISNISSTLKIDSISSGFAPGKLPGSSVPATSGLKLHRIITTLTIADPEKIIRQLSISPGSYIRAYYGTTPLMFKVKGEDSEAIKRFIDNKADEEES